LFKVHLKHMGDANKIYKKAASHTVLYGAANILRKIVGFLMIPIYTSYLSPEDYGAVELMMMVVLIAEVFLAMRMGQAIFRFYALAKSAKEKKEIMSSAFLLAICTGTIAFVILALNAGSATQLILGDIRYEELMSIVSVLLLLQVLEEYGLIYIRAHERVVLFFVLSVIKLVISFALNIYFIVFLELSVAGVVYSACISAAVMAMFSTVYTLYYSGLNFSMPVIRKLVIFSYPLWIAVIGSAYSASSVKYFLRVFSSLEDVGLYVLAVKFASLISVLIWMPFTNTWQMLRYEIYEMPEPNIIYKKIFISMVFILSTVGLGISLFSDVVIRFMADEAFWIAGSVVPVLVISSIVRSLTTFNNFGLLLKKKTGIIAVGAYFNAAITTIGFIIFIPIAGMHGAAWVVLFGAIIQLIWIEWKSKKYYYMELPWFRAALISLAWLVCYSASLILPETLFIAIIGKFIIIFFFVGFLFVTPLLAKEEKESLLAYTKTALNKISRYFISARN